MSTRWEASGRRWSNFSGCGHPRRFLDPKDERMRPAGFRFPRGALLLLVAGAIACSGGSQPDGRIDPVYDAKDGRLQRLDYDSDGDGTVDTVSHMDGSRVLRI